MFKRRLLHPPCLVLRSIYSLLLWGFFADKSSENALRERKGHSILYFRALIVR